MKKFRNFIIIFFTLNFIAGIFVYAEASTSTDTSVEKGIINGYDILVDDADLLSDEEEAQIIQRIYNIYKEHDFDVTILTMPKVPNGVDLLTYCDWYTELDVISDGVVFGISMNPSNREYATSTRNKGIRVFSSDALDVIDLEIKPLLKEENFFKAINEYLDYTEKFLERSKYGGSYKAPISLFNIIIFIILIPIFLALMLSVVIVEFGIVKKMNTTENATKANNFFKGNKLILNIKRDDFIREHTDKVYSPKSKSSGGNRSGAGGSRGGRSGSF